jgi:hypothetical protein
LRSPHPRKHTGGASNLIGDGEGLPTRHAGLQRIGGESPPRGGRVWFLAPPCAIRATFSIMETKPPVPRAILVGIQVPSVDDVAHAASIEELREEESESCVTSPTTAASPAQRKPSSMAGSASPAAPSALHLPRFRPLASCRRRLLARVEASLWPASAPLHMTGSNGVCTIKIFGPRSSLGELRQLPRRHAHSWIK